MDKDSKRIPPKFWLIFNPIGMEWDRIGHMEMPRVYPVNTFRGRNSIFDHVVMPTCASGCPCTNKFYGIMWAPSKVSCVKFEDLCLNFTLNLVWATLPIHHKPHIYIALQWMGGNLRVRGNYRLQVHLSYIWRNCLEIICSLGRLIWHWNPF